MGDGSRSCLPRTHEELFRKTDGGLLNLQKPDVVFKEAMEARIIGIEYELKEM